MDRENLDMSQPAATNEICAELHTQEEMLEVCLTTAEQLLHIATQEQQILENFHAEALLEILPEKEQLARSLQRKAASLKEAMNGNEDLKTDPQYVQLKECFQKIDRINRSNQIFIENTLAYYEDFLKRFAPIGYGFSQSRSHQQDCRFYRGRTFRKEI